MYAVLEFLTGEIRECGVVPLLWLVDNRKKCYWPKTRNEQTFEKLVKENTPHQNTWLKFSVHRVLETQADYRIAVERLNHILDNGTSEDGGLTINAVTMKSAVSHIESNISSSDRENSEVETGRKRKHKSRRHREPKKKKNKRNKVRQESSLESFDNSPEKDQENLNTPLDSCNNISISNLSLSCRTLAVMNSSCQKEGLPITPRSFRIPYGSLPDRQGTPARNSLQELTRNDSNLVVPISSNVSPSIQFTPGTNKSNQPMTTVAFQECVLKALDRINTKQEEKHLMLTQILITLEASLEPTGKPDGLPDFPLTDLDSFDEFEELLKSEVHFKYLKNRLSSIRGTCQRASVMAMLRFLLTNKLAMKFNWAGQNQKKSFKRVKVMAAIMDAAKVQFKGKHSSDKFIIDAVQSWLKLAKSRYQYEIAKIP